MADDQTTLQPGSLPASRGPAHRVALTLLAHPDPRRVGARCLLPRSGSVELSRRSPDFAGEPLEDPYLSRKPSQLSVSRGALRIEPNLAGAELRADGAALTAAGSFGTDELDRGVVLEVGGRAALLAQRVIDAPWAGEGCGLIGISDGIEAVRRQVEQVADLDVSVLLRGESGVGKELVAAAIHRQSGRGEGPFVAVNMAALTPSTAASALFGHRRGAFTGADRPRSGLFREADGGTLFLDEIGEAPPELQAMLLRTLETGQVLPVGQDLPIDVSVRVIAATDASLEDAIASGRFRLPLLHRLSGFELVVPPLRDRREDVALLLVGFLRQELDAIGEGARLDPTPAGADPWLPAGLVARLCLADWPGNVRQLRNVARQLVIASRGAERLQLTPAVERALGAGPVAPSSPAAPSLGTPEPATLRPADIDDAALLDALRRHDFQPTAAARALGISKTSIYGLIEASPSVRKARDLTREEIEEALATAGDARGAARRLEVSQRGLQLRITELAGTGSPEGG